MGGIFAAVSAAILTIALAACAQEPRTTITAPDSTTRAVVRVEVADTGVKRETGLMYRKHLDEDAGMIFVFTKPEHQTFWMKNTEIPLDMIFAGASGRIIGIAENAVPFSERMVSVAGDSQYVLEVNGGFCKRHGVRSGDALKFSGFVAQARE